MMDYCSYAGSSIVYTDAALIFIIYLFIYLVERLLMSASLSVGVMRLFR